MAATIFAWLEGNHKVDGTSFQMTIVICGLKSSRRTSAHGKPHHHRQATPDSLI